MQKSTSILLTRPTNGKWWKQGRLGPAYFVHSLLGLLSKEQARPMRFTSMVLTRLGVTNLDMASQELTTGHWSPFTSTVKRILLSTLFDEWSKTPDWWCALTKRPRKKQLRTQTFASSRFSFFTLMIFWIFLWNQLRAFFLILKRLERIFLQLENTGSAPCLLMMARANSSWQTNE